MTVSFVASGFVGCDWFDEENKAETKNFRPDQLILVNDDEA